MKSHLGYLNATLNTSAEWRNIMVQLGLEQSSQSVILGFDSSKEGSTENHCLPDPPRLVVLVTQ